jgi:hypothetical protein
MVLLFLCLIAVPAAQLAAGGKAATILLPSKVVAGKAATLAVLDEAGALLPGAEVEFRGGTRVTTDATGRATFVAPAEAGVLIAQSGAAKASATVILPDPNLPDGIQITESPQVASLHEPFSVAGSGFRGKIDGTQAMLGEHPALVLAASPTALMIQPGPRTPPGATQLVIQAGGRSPGPVPMTLVALEVSAEKKQLAPKEKGKLRVTARGSEQRLEIEVRNLTPAIIKMEPGEVLRLSTRGGTSNEAEVELEGRREGEFAVSVRLVPLPLGLPDTEAARQKLLAARHIAPEHWWGRLEALIDRLEKHPQDSLKVQKELEKMLAEKPEGEFGRLVEAAWLILLKK